MTNLIILLILLILGYAFGRLAEVRHYHSIRHREQQYRRLPIFATKLPPTPTVPAPRSVLVSGNTVVSVDYFKRFVAGLRALVGGRVKAYESLLDRGRREAILRMKEQAADLGANMIVNLKLETSSISKGMQNSVGTLEVLAYGTALIPTQEHASKSTHIEIAIPEDINVSNEHPLKEFVFLGAGVALGVTVLVFVFVMVAEWFAPLIPFKTEQRIAAVYASRIEQQIPPLPVTTYLQGLSERIAIAQGLPDEMTLNIHYIDDDTVNAFATLGGHVVMFRGLLEKLPNENALAMVLAHEIAHIKHRHPIKSLGRSAVIATAIAAVSGATGNDVAGQILGETGLLTVLKFNRSQEQSADETALTTLVGLYGHVGGAESLFAALKRNGAEPPEFFNTHPDTGNRVDDIYAIAGRQGWPAVGPITPLPAGFDTWLSTTSN